MGEKKDPRCNMLPTTHRLTWVMCCWHHEWCVCLLDKMNPKLFFFYCPFWPVIKFCPFWLVTKFWVKSPCGWLPTHLHHKIEKQNHVRCRLRKQKQGEIQWWICVSVISAASWKGSISPKIFKIKNKNRSQAE